MKNIRLMSLTIENFKGQKHLTLTFDGRSAGIYGDNAAGKSTVYDAFTWLLFGKDSRGQSGFEIKPLGPDGKVLDHALVTAVEAELSTGESRLTLRKTYYEKWSAKRGSAGETYDGNTSEYYIDGVPMKKYEYERRVAELVEEDAFRLLTGAGYFCSGLDWRERRRILFDLSGISGDRALLEREERFAPLLEVMGNSDPESLRKKLQAKRKGLVGARSEIPARLDECRKRAGELERIDYAAIQARRNERSAKAEALSGELLKLKHNSLLDAKRNERDRVRNVLAKLQIENKAHRRSQELERSPLAGYRKEKEQLQKSIAQYREAVQREEAELSRREEALEDCRRRWEEISGREFEGGQCPTCGQALPPDALREAEKRFRREKEKALADVAVDSEGCKKRMAVCREQIEASKAFIAAQEGRMAELSGLLETGDRLGEIQDAPGYAEGREALEGELRELTAQVEALEGESGTIKREIEDKLSALREEIAALDAALSKRELLSYTKAREEELRQEAASAAKELEQVDALLFLLDEFVRYKTKSVEEQVNRRFALIRWRLFAEQINGGVSECCEATVEGVPYGSLNSGMRLNAGLDAIAALEEHYGVRAPLFVDNAESVTRLRELEGQVIRLIVSKGERELRVEYEE